MILPLFHWVHHSLLHKILLFLLGHQFPKETFQGSSQETLNATNPFPETNLFMLGLNSNVVFIYNCV